MIQRWVFSGVFSMVNIIDDFNREALWSEINASIYTG